MRGMMMAGAMLLVGLLAAGCGRGGQPAGQPPAPAGGATTVNVSEKEWAIEFPASSVKAGQITFVISNNGAIEHNFVIREANVEVDAIPPGQSKQVTATLQPGTYTVVCTIPGHEEAGMKTTLTVTP